MFKNSKKHLAKQKMERSKIYCFGGISESCQSKQCLKHTKMKYCVSSRFYSAQIDCSIAQNFERIELDLVQFKLHTKPVFNATPPIILIVKGLQCF
jgi:hypothetical protein